ERLPRMNRTVTSTNNQPVAMTAIAPNMLTKSIRVSVSDTDKKVSAVSITKVTPTTVRRSTILLFLGGLGAGGANVGAKVAAPGTATHCMPFHHHLPSGEYCPCCGFNSDVGVS